MGVRMTDLAVLAEFFRSTQSLYRVQHCIIILLMDIASPDPDKPYPVHGGLFREEAIMLLRRFYVQENDKGTVF